MPQRKCKEAVARSRFFIWLAWFTEWSIMEAAEQDLARFEPAMFVGSCQNALRSTVRENAKEGVALGARRGIDSLAAAALSGLLGNL
jgi:hypothetical protein